jgi:hypothetical protein
LLIVPALGRDVNRRHLSAPFVKRQATTALLLIVVHRHLSKSFSEVGPVVVVLERPDHGKYFAWILGHELLGIVAENEANHLTFFLTW